ncbi:hypothetical protein AB0A73_21885 [Glycomyces sp. NPDC047369]
MTVAAPQVTCTRYSKARRRCRRPVAGWPLKAGHPAPAEACWLHLSESERLACLAAGGTEPADLAEPITDPVQLLAAPLWQRLGLHVQCAECAAAVGDTCTGAAMCPTRPAQLPTDTMERCAADGCDEPRVDSVAFAFLTRCWTHLDRNDRHLVGKQRVPGNWRADRRPFLTDVDHATGFWCPTCGRGPGERCVHDDVTEGFLPHPDRVDQAAAWRRAQRHLSVQVAPPVDRGLAWPFRGQPLPSPPFAAVPADDDEDQLTAAARRYHAALPGSPAAGFLRSRGLGDDRIAAAFGLGYVADPDAGHDAFRGMLAIPYLRHSPQAPLVTSMRFARIADGCDHDGHAAVSGTGEDVPRLFNARMLLAPVDEIAVCCSELDTITAAALGVPAVGVPGPDQWRPDLVENFHGYDRVHVIAPGIGGDLLALAEHLAASVPNAHLVACPDGPDLNAVHRRGRAEALVADCRPT